MKAESAITVRKRLGIFIDGDGIWILDSGLDICKSLQDQVVRASGHCVKRRTPNFEPHCDVSTFFRNFATFIYTWWWWLGIGSCERATLFHKSQKS